LLDLPGFEFDSSQEVLRAVPGVQVSAQGLVVSEDRLSNATRITIDLVPAPGGPATAAIYQLDGLVRRAVSLQMTADARLGTDLQEVIA
jgi:NADH-quinone oxidoreductase subunit G